MAAGMLGSFAQQLEIADQRRADDIAGDGALLTEGTQARDGGAELGRQQLRKPPAALDHGMLSPLSVPRATAFDSAFCTETARSTRATRAPETTMALFSLDEIQRFRRCQSQLAQGRGIGEPRLGGLAEARIGSARHRRETVHDERAGFLRAGGEIDPRAQA